MRAEQPIDDSYWSALFQTEDAFEYGAEPEPLAALPHPELGQTVDIPSQEDINAIFPIADPLPDDNVDDPWALAQACMDEDRVLQLRVTDHNKGGLLLEWHGLPGFVPASQLIDFPQFHLPRERVASLAEWHERELQLKIIEVNKLQNRLIFSERATLVAAEQKENLLSGVQPGQQLHGLVTNLADFGAFVDLGGVEGLIHKSQISWSRVQHPGDVLQPGQTVEVLVLSVDQDAGRIALSMKQLRPDPWQTAEERYKPGQHVRGIVGHVMHYGAFIILEQELEGLVHYTELAEGAFLHPRDVVRTGEEVVARVLAVDGHRKRIALSLRGLDARPEPRN